MKRKEMLIKRRSVVAKRYLEGWTQEQIAVEFSVSHQTISNDLKALREEWRKGAADAIDDLHAQSLAQIRMALADLWDQWNKSKDRYGQGPDPRIMNELGKWFDRLTKLLGLNAPSKVEIESQGLQPVLNVVIQNESPAPETIKEMA